MERDVKNSATAAAETGSADRPVNFISPLTLLLIAGWFGLLTGLAEAIFQIGQKRFILPGNIGLNLNVLWMAPLAEMLIFILAGAVLSLFAWRLPRLFTVREASFAFAFLSCSALFLLLPQLHVYARWLLTIGLSVQTARVIGRRQAGFVRLVRRTSVWLVGAVTVSAFGIYVWQSATERRAVAKLPPAPAGAPNVLLITLDTVRAKSLSLYGYERKTTPQLERLARDGAVFETAIAPSPWTLPTHASIFTGRYPGELNTGWVRPLNTDHKTLAEELTQRGYESAGFVANYQYCSRETGLDRGMIRYEDYPVSPGQVILSASLGRAISNAGLVRRTVGYHETLNRKRAEQLNDDFLGWLSSRDQQRPFFAFLNYFDAHEPLLPPAPFDGLFGPTRAEAAFEYDTNDIAFADHESFSESDSQKFRNAYYSSIAYLDDRLGSLFAELSENGLLENTVVIITSDHGELLGGHNMFSHGNSLYIQTLRVPLLIRFPPRVPKNVRIREPVSLRDLPATVLDFLGGKDQTVFPGRSLARHFDRKAGGEHVSEDRSMMLSELEKTPWLDPIYPASKGEMKSIVTGQYHYILNGDGSEELYDLKKDPNEKHNLAQTAEAQKTLEKFRLVLKDTTRFK